MILESIQLEHLGPFGNAVAVGPFTRALNVLAAPNESGKTTFVKAATRALFDRHTCKDSEIRALQPAGTDFGPGVSVVFQVASGKFRIRKQFLMSPQCQLSAWRDGQWEPISEGDEADRRLAALLNFQPPGRGASREVNWGLMRYLWARQGEPTAWPSWDDASGRQIQNRLAKVELDPLCDRLRIALWNDYLQVFTATGQTKAAGPLRKAEEEWSRLEADLQELREKSRQLEDLRANFESVTAQLTRLKSEAVEKRKEAEAIRELAVQAELLTIELKARQEAWETAKAALHTIDSDLEGLGKLQAELAEAKARLAATEETLAQQSKAAQAHAETQARLESELESRQNVLAKTRSSLERARQLIKHRRDRQDLERLESLARKVHTHLGHVEQLQTTLQRLPALTVARLRQLEKDSQRIHEQTAQLRVLGLSVELTPHRPCEVQINTPDLERKESLPAGETATFHAAQTLHMSLAGWGKISVRSGSHEAKDIAAKLQECQRAFREKLLEFGVESFERAQAVLIERQDLEAKLQTTQSALQALLTDWESPNAFDQDLHQRRTRLAAIEAASDYSEAEMRESLANLEAAEQQFAVQVELQDQEFKSLAKTAKLARTETAGLRDRVQQSEKQLASLRGSIHGTEQQIEALRKRYGGELEKARSAARQAFVEAEARLEVTRKKLPADHERLPERNKRAAKAAEEVGAELAAGLDEASQLEGRLKTLGSEGLYTKISQRLEQREIAARAASAARARGWAARLLHDLIEYRKLAATRSVLAPLEDRLSSVFADITGRRNRRVYLDENLQILGVGRDGKERIAFEHLSQGAREQLLLALRLAVAAELSVDEPQLLILDDVLVNTDGTRQDRILDLLQQAAETMQILILTCHPDRYRGIGQPLTISG